MCKKYVITIITCLASAGLFAQQAISKAWVADNGDGTYKNPVVHADYSDPDAIRVGDDYYMISSSFNHSPGLPILHSRDLVNWKLIGHALQRQQPFDHFSKVQHGNGVWAPSIRYHRGEFYIYYPDPDFGIYLTKAKSIHGPWSEPVMVEAGKGLIDPCPLWDDDGTVYLVHAYAGSRAGIKSVIVVKKLNAEGTKTVDNGVLVYDGHELDPTIEGPKFHKRNGWYYIFAPAGGVSTGWQTVLRSKKIYGPYERKVVMDQGTTAINGPHQGAWVDTKTGEHWFLHFQDKEAFGRIVHLQPMKWVNDWPVIGEDKDRDGKGQPVLNFKKPNVGRVHPISTVADSDEFDGSLIGFQWQWQANPKPYWAFATGSKLRLFSYPVPDSAKNYWDVPNLLLQKFPASEFSITTRLSFHPRLDGEKAGLIIQGMDYAYVAVTKKSDGNYISYVICKNADKGAVEQEQWSERIDANEIILKVNVTTDGKCHFSYEVPGDKMLRTVSMTQSKPVESFVARPGRWVGAQVGVFCTRTIKTNDSGFADFDYFRVEPIVK